MDSRSTQHHPRAIAPAELIGEARRWLGTPYRHQGRGEGGLDCVGLVIRVAEDLKLMPDEFVRNYGRLPRAELIEEASRVCTRLDAAEPGCLILIRWPRERIAGHAALFTGVNLIHSYSTVRKVVEHGYRRHWVDWTDSFWRIPGVSGG